MKHATLIEGLWGQLKGYIKKIYNTLPGTINLKDYIYEALFRRSIKQEQQDDRANYILNFYKKMNGLLDDFIND